MTYNVFGGTLNLAQPNAARNCDGVALLLLYHVHPFVVPAVFLDFFVILSSEHRFS